MKNTPREELHRIAVFAACIMVLFAAAVFASVKYDSWREAEKAREVEAQKRQLKFLQTTDHVPILDAWLQQLQRDTRWHRYTCWRGGDMGSWECTLVDKAGNPDVWLDVHCLEAEGRCWLSRHP